MSYQGFTIEKISFLTIKSYWEEVNHFQIKNKKNNEFIKYLGHFTNSIEEPRQQAYGLFFDKRLIGVTKLVCWNNEWVRYRTLNIRKEFRGKDLGWYLLSNAWKDGWCDYDIFGWVRSEHQNWCLKKGFVEIDGVWQDDHLGMLLAREKL